MNARLQNAEGIIVGKCKSNECFVRMNHRRYKFKNWAFGDTRASDVSRQCFQHCDDFRPWTPKLPPSLCVILSWPDFFSSFLFFTPRFFKHAGHDALFHDFKSSFESHCINHISLTEINDPARWLAGIDQIIAGQIRMDDRTVIWIFFEKGRGFLASHQEFFIVMNLTNENLFGIFVCF